MGFFRRYVDYLQHNPEGYWFKRRAFGWGWIPATKEGWITLTVYILVYAGILIPFIRTQEPSPQQVTVFLVAVFAWVLSLLYVCYKTGEPPKWQWGIPKGDKPTE